jgi:Ca2+-transporting ATPase
MGGSIKCGAMTPGAYGPSRDTGNPFLRVLWLTVVKYSAIDGQQQAASFAYYAFFALFPLLLLLVSIGSFFLNPSRVGDVVLEAVSRYVLVESDKHDMVTETIHGVIKARRGVGVFAVLGLLWSSLRFFQSLVIGVNRAWGTHEYSWWRLPLQNLLMVGVLASALIIGFMAPLILKSAEMLLISGLKVSFWSYLLAFGFDTVRFLVPSGVLFYGISLFYKLAPRRPTTFREVWLAALVVALVLQVLQGLFVLYARNVAHFNAVYGAFGSVIAVLMWVYLSGSVIILGGCYCAARAEVAGTLHRGVEEADFEGPEFSRAEAPRRGEGE